MAAPGAVEEGPARSPNTDPEAVTPAESPEAPREEEPDRFKKNLASSVIADGRAVKDVPPAPGVTSPDPPGTAAG